MDETPEERKVRLAAQLQKGRETAAANRAAGKKPKPRRRHPGPQAAAAGHFPKDVVAAPISVDVEALVREAVAKALAGIAAPNAAPNDPDARLRQLTEQLALSIGNLTNQNSGQTLVPPEVLAQRRDAERRMVERIDLAKSRVEQARAAGDPDRAAAEMPLYRLTAKIIAPLMNGDELVEPLRRGSDNIVRPVEIDWPLVPNLAMVPVNGPAQEIFALFKEFDRQSGERQGRQCGRPRAERRACFCDRSRSLFSDKPGTRRHHRLGDVDDQIVGRTGPADSRALRRLDPR